MKYTLLLISVFAFALKAVQSVESEVVDDSFDADGTTDTIVAQSPEYAGDPDESFYSVGDMHRKLNDAFIGNEDEKDDDLNFDGEYPEELVSIPFDPNYEDGYLNESDGEYFGGFNDSGDSGDDYESFGLSELFENQ